MEFYQSKFITVFLATVIVRILVFPLVIIAQKNVARLNNHMPQMQTLQEKMSDARRRGDLYESAALGGEMQKMMKEILLKTPITN